MTTCNPAFADELAALRPYLLRVALGRLRDAYAAEEVVQDTLAAAIATDVPFAGRSRLSTWVTGILLHKVTDAFRARKREAGTFHAPEPESGDDPDFDAQGTWRAPLTAWSDPETALASSRFRAALTRALEKLPAPQSRAFVMREMMGLESGEICATLGVSETNLWVLLHRARLALRRGLDRDFFSAA